MLRFKLSKETQNASYAHVQTTKLETVLQGNETLENELQNTKAKVGTFKAQKEELEQHIQSLKMQVEQLSLDDPNFPLVLELRKLSIKDLEFKL